MLAILLLGLAAGTFGAEEFQDTRVWECDGGVKYYDAPIIFYYNKSKTLCYAARKGCLTSQINKTYTTFEECMISNFPAGRTVTTSFMCENFYYGNAVLTFEVGKKKQFELFYLLKGCDDTERFCPKGYACAQSNEITSCCAVSTPGESYFRAWYNTTLINGL